MTKTALAPMRISDPKWEPQVPPLRYAPVGMTIQLEGDRQEAINGV
jgi:hypothetical protein